VQCCYFNRAAKKFEPLTFKALLLLATPHVLAYALEKIESTKVLLLGHVNVRIRVHALYPCPCPFHRGVRACVCTRVHVHSMSCTYTWTRTRKWKYVTVRTILDLQNESPVLNGKMSIVDRISSVVKTVQQVRAIGAHLGKMSWCFSLFFVSCLCLATF
jgi:hypothetical protein